MLQPRLPKFWHAEKRPEGANADDDDENRRRSTYHVRQNECPQEDETGLSAGSEQIAHASNSSSSESNSATRPPLFPACRFSPAPSDSESDDVSPKLSPLPPPSPPLPEEPPSPPSPLGACATRLEAMPLAPANASGGFASDEREDSVGGVDGGAGVGVWPASEGMAGVMPSRLVAL